MQQVFFRETRFSTKRAQDGRTSLCIFTMDVKHIHLPTARVIHDGQPEMPFWGWPTSTIDWCEESTSSYSSPSAIVQSLELTVPKIDYKITPYIAEFVNTVTNAFFSKDFGCHGHFLTLVQFPWHCTECEIRSDKSIILGLLQPSWASCLSELDLGCSMPRSSIRFVPQFRISRTD